MDPSFADMSTLCGCVPINDNHTTEFSRASSTIPWYIYISKAIRELQPPINKWQMLWVPNESTMLHPACPEFRRWIVPWKGKPLVLSAQGTALPSSIQVRLFHRLAAGMAEDFDVVHEGSSKRPKWAKHCVSLPLHVCRGSFISH